MNFVCKIDRDPYKGLYLQFNLLLDTTNDTKVEIYKLDDEEKLIYNSIDYIKPLNNQILLNQIVYLEENYLTGIDTTFKVRCTNKNNTSEEETAKAINYKFSLGEVITKHETIENKYYSYFEVYIDNFSSMQIKDLRIVANKESDKESAPSNCITSNTRTINAMLNSIKVIDKLDITQFITKNNNVVDHLEYRLKGTIGGQEVRFPETGTFKFDIVKENTAPEISLKNIDLKSYGNSFQLFFDAFIRDSELDDVHFNIYDNHGNILFQQDYYTYVPKIEKVEYLYQIKHFSSLFLELRAEITDNKTFSTKETFEVPLFKVSNLRITRDILYWDLVNYSSSVLKTQVEILDINDNIVYRGKTQSNRFELKQVTVTDGQIVELLRTDEIKYYKFRIRVSCEEENYVGYYEFDNGTLTSTKWHEAPLVKINSVEFTRSIEDEKRVKVDFSIKDAVTERYFEDLITYKIFDDSGNIIYSTYDLFALPEKGSDNIVVNVPYNFTNQPETTITVEVTTEYNKQASDSMTQNAYYFKAAPIKDQQALEFEMDNYFVGSLFLRLIGLVKLPLDKEGNQYYEEVIKELEIPNTIDRIKSSIRFVPKLYNEDKTVILYRVAIVNEEFPNLNIENGKFIYEKVYESLTSDIETSQREIRAINDQTEEKAEEYYTFPSMKNRTPSIVVNNYINEFNGSKSELTVRINFSITDLDKDKIRYMISDKFECIKKSDGFIDTYPTNGKIDLIVSKTYQLFNLDTSFIQIYIEAEDEDGAYDEIPFKIPLHDINCINFSEEENEEGKVTAGLITWNYRLYSKKAIRMVIEILDNEGYLYGKSKVLDGLYSNELKTISQRIDFENYNEGQYRFRIKTYSQGETWSMFYPNSMGYEFHIDDKGEVVPINKPREETDENPFDSPSNSITNDSYLESVYSPSNLTAGKLALISNKDEYFSNPYDSTIRTVEQINSSPASPINNYGHPIGFNSINYRKILLRDTIIIKDENDNDKEKLITRLRLPIQKYNYRIFKDGKKILENHYRKQDHYDNYNLLFIEKDECDGEKYEIETWGNLLMDAEQFTSKDKESLDVLTDKDIFDFYHGQKVTKNFFYDPLLTNIIIIRNGMRINPKLFNIKETLDKHLAITIRDRLYIGDKILLTSDKLFNRTVVNEKVTTANDGENLYTKPLYYIPFSYAMIDDQIITDIKTEQAEIYINGYCAIPEVDYIITDPKGGNFNIPSLIVFRDLLMKDSEVEIIYRGTDVDKPYAVIPCDMTVTLNEGEKSKTIEGSVDISKFHTIKKGNFSLYVDRYKIPSKYLKIDGSTISIEDKTIEDKKENKYKKTISEETYNRYKTFFGGKERGIEQSIVYIRTNLPNNILGISGTSNTIGKPSVHLTVKSSDDNLEFANYIYDLSNDELLNFFKEENLSLDFNNSISFTNSTVAPNNIEFPKLFNRNIDVMAMGSANNFSNAKILNPSRILQFSDNDINTLDCNDNSDNGLFDINLNENIDYSDLDCITSDIIISVKNKK